MSDQNPNPNPQSPKYFDVVRPGQSVPSFSSKPIIVSNKPPQRDPMMSPNPMPGVTTSPPATLAQGPEEPVAIIPNNPVQVPDVAKTQGMRHRIRIMLPLLIGILILFVIADLLVDANVIHTSVTPLTNFFHHH